IPWTGTGPTDLSFQQGIYEGNTKDKWEPLYRKIAEYLPPPRTIVAMVRAGSLTDSEALALFQDAGLSQALAAAYISDAHAQKLAGSKDLAKGDITSLYGEGAISAADATTFLATLGYNATDAAFELARVDFARLKSQIDKALSRIQSLYVAHKLDALTAGTALDALGIPPAQKSQLLATWALERGANVQILTAAEVCDAVYYSLMTIDDGLAQLQYLGYSARDAWLRLGVRLHAPPTATEPPAAPAGA
ncbi:MAG TPA: hypothetical protein VNL71_03885, partial [Chloroflexota bacterium]|nr:hypothetical protein [Chloroflexota bacterium]